MGRSGAFTGFLQGECHQRGLRKARRLCRKTYLLFGLTGEKVDGRKIAIGFRLWIRCHRL